MSYKILVDSCGELTEEMKASGMFERIPLTIMVGSHEIVDDETFDQADFLRKVAAEKDCPKSACPSPERYLSSMECGADHVYIVTLSSQLSGSYNSAMLAGRLFEEAHKDKNWYVIDSKSASIGETLLAMKIQECEEAGMEFEQVISEVEAYREEQHTYFVLESLEALRKNGRLKGVKALVAQTLNIKPVMAATEEGNIQQLSQARGMKKGLAKMIDCIEIEFIPSKNRIIGVSHCNCKERGQQVLDQLKDRLGIEKGFLIDTEGISSLYASDGGIIVVV